MDNLLTRGCINFNPRSILGIEHVRQSFIAIAGMNAQLRLPSYFDLVAGILLDHSFFISGAADLLHLPGWNEVH